MILIAESVDVPLAGAHLLGTDIAITIGVARNRVGADYNTPGPNIIRIRRGVR